MGSRQELPSCWSRPNRASSCARSETSRVTCRRTLPARHRRAFGSPTSSCATAATKWPGRTVTEAVLDASALLAFLLGEPGADKVAAVLTNACISAVNLAETFGKLVEHGKPRDEIRYQIGRLQLTVAPFDAEHVEIAAAIWMATRAHGLSLGDRACLALAKQRALPAFTTEG